MRKVRELKASGERMADELKEKDRMIAVLEAEKHALEQEDQDRRERNDHPVEDVEVVKTEVSTEESECNH